MGTNGGHKIREEWLHAVPDAEPKPKRLKLPPVINYLGAIPISFVIIFDAIFYPHWWLIVPLVIGQCLTWWFGCLACWFGGQAKALRKDYS